MEITSIISSLNSHELLELEKKLKPVFEAAGAKTGCLTSGHSSYSP